VNVAGETGSEASKNLRRGLATILAVYRDVAVDSYYGEAASVINYPISNTSWALLSRLMKITRSPSRPTSTAIRSTPRK
jgi:hypothetical protein